MVFSVRHVAMGMPVHFSLKRTAVRSVGAPDTNTTFRVKLKLLHLPMSQPSWQQQPSCGSVSGWHVETIIPSRLAGEGHRTATPRAHYLLSAKRGHIADIDIIENVVLYGVV
jgi:hypothetical protein